MHLMQTMHLMPATRLARLTQLMYTRYLTQAQNLRGMRAVQVLCRVLIAIVVLGAGASAHAHDAISAEARKAYLARLDELAHTAQSNAPAPVRANAWLETGKTLDEIRALLNEDIISHGKTQGLETSVLVSMLNASVHKLQLSPHSRLYLSNPRPYREALALDPRSKGAALARFLLFKHHFYDSFVEHPLKPLAQSKESLLEMISFGESLVSVRDPVIDSEEVHFILGIHYLQALESGALSKAKCQSRVAEIQKKFRSQWPGSLKLATLEALSSP